MQNTITLFVLLTAGAITGGVLTATIIWSFFGASDNLAIVVDFLASMLGTVVTVVGAIIGAHYTLKLNARQARKPTEETLLMLITRYLDLEAVASLPVDFEEGQPKYDTGLPYSGAYSFLGSDCKGSIKKVTYNERLFKMKSALVEAHKVARELEVMNLSVIPINLRLESNKLMKFILFFQDKVNVAEQQYIKDLDSKNLIRELSLVNQSIMVMSLTERKMLDEIITWYKDHTS